jgi:hypothetical protein
MSHEERAAILASVRASHEQVQVSTQRAGRAVAVARGNMERFDGHKATLAQNTVDLCKASAGIYSAIGMMSEMATEWSQTWGQMSSNLQPFMRALELRRMAA